MKKLEKWLKIFHELTFNIEKQFQDIESYEARLRYAQDIFFPKIREIRKSFIYAILKDSDLKKNYFEYLKKEQDYIFFANTNINTPDQRKFGNKLNPFIVFWYQILIFELYKKFNLVYWKSRDMGLTFSILVGEAMHLATEEGGEAFFLSRTQKDVDIVGDRRQTNMGRLRQIIENSTFFNLKDFVLDKHLFLYSSNSVGIQGVSTNGDPARGGRASRGFVDEAGAQDLESVKQSLSFSVNTIIYAGTLKIAKGQGFRGLIENSTKIEPKEIFNNWLSQYRKHSKDNILTAYRKSWDEITTNLGIKYGKTALLGFCNTYRDHPFKAGNCNYRELEEKRLYNDSVIIAHELDANLNAGSPDRSFYHIQDTSFKSLNFKDYKGFNLFMGFDPGSHGTAAITPVIENHLGQLLVFKTEIFNKGSMLEWVDRILNFYGDFTLFAEESIKAYSKAGAGWLPVFRKKGVKIQIVSNRNIEDQLLVVNEIAGLRIKDVSSYEDKKINKLLLDDNNKWWAMSYISGAKYSNLEQRKMSHPAESFIAVIFGLNKRVIGNDNSISIGKIGG